MPLALVTGGAIRVGRAIAVALARAGYDIIVHSHSSPADATCADITALGRTATVEKADLSVRAEAIALGQRIRKLDLLVNNAALYSQSALHDVTPEAFDKMLALNLTAPFFLTQSLLPALKGGSIVNITDTAIQRPYSLADRGSHYFASKGALEALTYAWSRELAPDIRVNAVAPGTVAMPVADPAVLARVPLQREGSPRDVASAVVFLAQSPYITGQTLRVDGGL